MLELDKTVRQTCQDILDKHLDVLKQQDAEPYTEHLISSKQRDVIVQVFSALGLDVAAKEIKELPELVDYEMRED